MVTVICCRFEAAIQEKRLILQQVTSALVLLKSGRLFRNHTILLILLQLIFIFSTVYRTTFEGPPLDVAL